MQNRTSLHHRPQPLSPAASLAAKLLYACLLVPVLSRLDYPQSFSLPIFRKLQFMLPAPTWPYSKMINSHFWEIGQPTRHCNPLGLEQFCEHLAVHIRQPKITTLIAISQPLMVKP